MVAALKKLDYNVYDFFENFDYLFDDWWKILEYGGTAEDFRRMYENVDAITDVPGNHFWEEIMEAFPDVKVIKTKFTKFFVNISFDLLICFFYI